ncbi:MAG: PAS domain S-box protein [Anaerolineae bacterium]|nr:PAS domain S-box protein [Anaerolineae bacterium]
MDLFALADGPLSLDYSQRPLVQDVMAGEMAGSREVDHEGTPTYGSFVTLAFDGWGIVVETPMRAIRAESDVLATRLLVINTALFVIGLGVTFVFVRRITRERKRAEEELRLWGVVLDQIQDHVTLTDLSGVITYVNEAEVESSGYSRDEIIGQATEVYGQDPKLGATQREIIERTLRDGVWRGDVVNHASDGRTVIMDCRTHVIRDSDGEPLFLCDIATDITRRRQAEDALRQRNRELAMLHRVGQTLASTLDQNQVLDAVLDEMCSLLSATGASVWLLDPQSEELVCHRSIGPRSEAVVGWRLRLGEGIAGWVARSGESLIVPDTHADERFYAGVDQRLGLGLRSILTAPLRVKETVIGVIQVLDTAVDHFSSADLAAAEQLSATAAIAIENARLYEHAREEIAERVRVEEHLRESEEKYRLHFENVTDVIYSIDPEFRVLSISPSVEGLLGYKPEELIGKPFQDVNIVASDYVGAASSDIMRVLAGKRIDSAVYEFIAKDGTRKLGEVSGSPVMRDGKVVAIVSVARDITAREQMERQLRQHERLAAVGQLSAGIAHDFRNLLTTIILYANITLRRPGLPPNVRPDIETIISESKRAADLVQQILDFSSRSMIRVQALELQGLAQGVIDILRRTLLANIRVTLSVEGEDAASSAGATLAVEADSGRIEQVLMNLALNAQDAMPRGGDLRFELSRMPLEADDEPPVPDMGPGEWVCVAVSDTGTGMMDEVRAHLFEPFFTTKEVGKGTGLGLAQVYGIVRQHEGHIAVDTAVGSGTVFRIYLPAYKETLSGEEGEEPSAPLQGQGETILLVEDHEKLREAGQSVLESLGYRVLTAASGREALMVYEAEGGVDLVLTDLVMPEMGGKELVLEIRSKDPSLKAVGITGYAVEEVADELRGAGFLDVIYKPFEVETLAQVIHRALHAKAGRWT